MTLAHIAGIPLEETLAMGGPALLTAIAAAVARLRTGWPTQKRPGSQAGCHVTSSRAGPRKTQPW